MSCSPGHFLLTNLLADELKKGQPSRVVNLSSAAHSMAYAPEGIRLDDLEGKQHYTEVRQPTPGLGC